MRRMLRRLWRKRIHPWVGYWVGEYQEWRFTRRYARAERQREEVQRRMEIDTLQRAQAKALLAQLDQTTIAALKAVVTEEVLPELRGEALELARQELAEELAKGRERQEDRYAKLVDDWQDEIERRIEDGVQRGTRDLKDELAEELGELKSERQEAKARAAQAERQLVALLQQLLPAGKMTYLYNAGLRELPLTELNATLARVKLVLKSRQTYSDRMVACVTAPGKVEGKTLFWLEPLSPEGVADEDEGDPEEPPNRLALPKGEPPEGM
jgi:hypothetical protein